MYRPLPDSLTIKSSPIHGLGLHAIKDIPKGTDLGISHRQVLHKPLFRTPLGGFYNHSDDPNCIKEVDGHGCQYYLITLRDIKAEEEITVKYTFYKVKKL